MSSIAPNPLIAPPHKPTLFGLQNLTGKLPFLCEPWTFRGQIPVDALQDELSFESWQNQATTEHLFLSATEPMDSAFRTEKHNPAYRVHGAIADYRAKIDGWMIENIRAWCPRGLGPTLLTRTRFGVTAIWLFGAPVTVGSSALTRQFLTVAKRELALLKLLPGFDKKAWFDLSRFYPAGTEWQQMAESFVPPSITQAWLAEAKIKLTPTSQLVEWLGAEQKAA